MRYYIIAGERSGDLHGSNLIRAIRRHDASAVFRGFGGDMMKEAGQELAVHYNEMAFMGFVALITNYGKIRRMLAFCKEDIEKFAPDVVIHIDYGGFNRRIAAFAKAKGIRTFYYIPPKVWAWYTRRAWELKRNVDRMFVILPFEKEFFRTYGMEVDYVGNPVLDAVKAYSPSGSFLQRHQLPADKPLIALLPGSRKMELLRIVPVMRELIATHPEWCFVVAGVDSLADELYKPLRDAGAYVTINETYDLLHAARAAVVTSGTATLETSLFKVPQVCVYRAGWLEMKIARAVVKVKFISLVNLIAGREVIRELIQEQATPNEVSAELRRIVPEGTDRTVMLKGYSDIMTILDTGSASENAARLMVGYLRGN